MFTCWFPQKIQQLTAPKNNPSLVSVPYPQHLPKQSPSQSLASKHIQPTDHHMTASTTLAPMKNIQDPFCWLQRARHPSHSAENVSTSLRQRMGKSLCCCQGVSHHFQAKHPGQLRHWELPHLLWSQMNRLRHDIICNHALGTQDSPECWCCSGLSSLRRVNAAKSETIAWYNTILVDLCLQGGEIGCES